MCCPGYRYETDGEERWYINSRLYYIGDGVKTDSLESIPRVFITNLTDTQSEELMIPGCSKTIEFTTNNYNGSALNKVSLDCFLKIEIPTSINISHELYDITDGQEKKLSISSNGYGPITLSNKEKENKKYKLVLTWNETDDNIKNAGQTFDCSINIQGTGEYDRILARETTSLKSYGYNLLTATSETISETEGKYRVSIMNNNPYDVTCIISGSENFISKIDGSSIKELKLSANSSAVLDVSAEVKESELYLDSQKDSNGRTYAPFNIFASLSKPYIGNKEMIVQNLKVYLSDSIKGSLVTNAESIHEFKEGERFNGPSAINEKDLCSIVDPVSGQIVYFYRGNVTNNYVSFAGKLWRILRINDDGSLRIILDSSAGTSQYATSATPSSNTIEKALDLISWKKSKVYEALHTWYNNNIANNPTYSSYVVESKFVFDNTYKLTTSTAGEGECYYFGPYSRIGVDEDNYQPTFSYNSNTLVNDVVGLITVDEILYAGGYWGQDNKNYFLYNSSITTDTWTMSPSFWDYNSHHKAGVMTLGKSGKADDWPGNNTLAEKIGFRPVISIRGDLDMSGNGTKTNPYSYR